MQRLELTAARLAELKEVNAEVNEAMPYKTDRENYGVEERWIDLNDAAMAQAEGGDCEDAALTKGAMLRESGWPLAVLDIAICRTRKGEGHAVLMIRTDQGDKVLDNATDEILPWNRTRYDWVQITVGGKFTEWEKMSDE